jgi:hypothetical protein
MTVFAVFDIREVAHQFSESNASLGLVGIVVPLLHASAAIGAVVLWRVEASSIATQHRREELNQFAQRNIDRPGSPMFHLMTR